MNAGLRVSDRRLLGLVAGFGTLFTGFLLLFSFREIGNHAEALFLSEGARIREACFEEIRGADEILHNIAALFSASGSEVDSDSFRIVAEGALTRQPTLRTLSFSRWVPNAERGAFETKMAQPGGVVDYQIHGEAGERPERENYLPITFFEPLTPRSISLLGLDLLSVSHFAEPIQDAVDTGTTVSVGPLTLEDRSEGFLLIKAVYSGKVLPSTPDQRRQSLVGVIRIGVGTRALFERVSLPQGFSLHFKASQDKPTADLVAFAQSRRPGLELASFKLSDGIKISGRRYLLEITSSVPFTARALGFLTLTLFAGLGVCWTALNRASNFLRKQRELLERQAEIERKVEEKTRALRKSEETLRTVIDANPNLIFARDSQGTVLLANQAFHKLAGGPSGSLLERAVCDFPRTGTSGALNEVVFGAADLKRRFEIAQAPLDLEGHPDSVLYVGVDITQRKASEALIADQQSKMVTSSRLSALGEMAGGIAHEINSPLAALKLIAEQIVDLLGDESIDRPMLTKKANVIEKTVDRIAKIISGLRNFARDGSNDPFRRFAVAEMVEETLSFCREKLARAEIDLRVDPISPNLEIEGREIQISQVLLNLLNNARDAVTHAPEKWIHLSVKELENSVEISVTDSGSPIPDSVREKLFSPFFTTKELGKGTGLGLSISKNIIAEHRGTLQLDADPRITRFFFLLPKCRPQ